MERSVATYTLGCRVNQYETDAVVDLFKRSGYEIKNFNECAGIYIINTCTVTSLSDRKSRQIIRRCKKNNKDAVTVVMGCYAQAKPDEVLDIEGVDIVIGNGNKSKIVEYVEEYLKDRKKKKIVSDIMSVEEYDNLSIRDCRDRTRAFIKIQDGCNNFCSYCVIPYVRGPVRSKALMQIVKEIENLVNRGYKEVVLTGIHAASYGKDLKDVDLVDLVYEVYKIDGIERIRFGSLEPNIVNEKFIKMFKELSDKVCNHLHLSLQSGCDATLKRMNRKYTKDMYRDAVNILRENVPDILITTDVIVGFPGETEDEFRETVMFLEEINFYKIHVFKYSKRSGTRAAAFANQVADEIKDIRSEYLIKLSDSGTIRYNKNCLGKEVCILIERRLDSGYYEGLTSNYIRVLVDSIEELKKGEIYNIYLKKVEGNSIIGSIPQHREEFFMNNNNTMMFSVENEKEEKVENVLLPVYEALKEKGYNPINQIVGYLISGDPAYITNYRNARNLMSKLEREEILEDVLGFYIKNNPLS